MPPQLIIAALMAGTQLTQALWNGRSNELAMQQERMNLRKKQGFADTQYFSQLGAAFQQQQEGAKNAVQAQSMMEARAADTSMAGPSAQDYVNAGKAASDRAFSGWNDQTFNGLDLARQQQTDAFTQQYDEMQFQQNAASLQYGLQAATSPLTFLTSAYNSNTGKMDWDPADPGWGKAFNPDTGVGLNPETGDYVSQKAMELGGQSTAWFQNGMDIAAGNAQIAAKGAEIAAGMGAQVQRNEKMNAAATDTGSLLTGPDGKFRSPNQGDFAKPSAAQAPALPPEAEGSQVMKPSGIDKQTLSDFEFYKQLAGKFIGDGIFQNAQRFKWKRPLDVTLNWPTRR